MPAYSIEFTTDRGPQRLPFTLDDDRALAPQLAQILEELRQQGMVIAGGPGDEAGAAWNGRHLDSNLSPAELGISPIRPIEIRMRRPAPKAAAPVPELPPRSFLAKGGVAGAMAGMGGALASWMITGFWNDLGDLLFSYPMLDLATATLFGALVCGAIGLADSARARRNIALGTLSGLGLGAVGGAVGGFLSVLLNGLIANDATTRGFVAFRIMAWTALGLTIGGVAALAHVRTDQRRIVDGLIWGAVGGVIAGLMYSLPGPGDLWNAVAFIVLGLAIGAGLTAPALQRSVAILERENPAGGPFKLFGAREVALRSTAVRVSDGGAEATVEPTQGGFVLRPGGTGVGLTVAGRAIGDGVRLRNGDSIGFGNARYVFRRMRAS
jgi:hypothetical protein